MVGYETEKPEGYHPVKEDGESIGSISAYPNKHKKAGLKLPFGLHFCVKRTPAFYVALVSLILNLALTITILSLSVRTRGPSPPLPTRPVVSCPSGWVGYQGRCYYFAKAEGNWTSSKRHCSSLNASLAVVDSQEEMDFIMRYKGNADHWIGLERNQNQPWTWIDGTIFNGWFPILGGGSCAYVSQLGIASSTCSKEEPWICSKPLVGVIGLSLHHRRF